ncbi:hypothetical protein [Streptomyces bobili]|uniref:hypothetical protein n=1 Tax=Streptomyces bobili TaxID=67280 RepID=UPI0037FC1D88
MSYDQTNPYAGQHHQQSGPYGPPAQAPQPGYGHPPQVGYPSFQQSPYGSAQNPYVQEPSLHQQPPGPTGGQTPSGMGRRAALIRGAVALVVAVAVAVAVGAYLVRSGEAGDVAGDVAGDGPHKLTVPAQVLGDYKKDDKQPTTPLIGIARDAEKLGVAHAQSVSASYTGGKKSDPLSQKLIHFDGVYGEIQDPESVVDAFLAQLETRSIASGEKDGTKVTMIGDPRSYDVAEGAVVKCQQVKVEPTNASAAGPKEMYLAYCVWGDHSTAALVSHTNIGAMLMGKKPNSAAEATVTAKLREEVRVKH